MHDREIMSENVHAEPYITKDVHQEYRESVVDIYVSAESLRVYENPWVENVSPGHGETQHPGMVTTSAAGGLAYFVHVTCLYI